MRPGTGRTCCAVDPSGRLPNELAKSREDATSNRAEGQIAYSGYLDFYKHGPYASSVKEQRAAGLAPIQMFEADQPAGEYPDAPTPDLMLGLLRWGNATHELDLGAGRWRGRCAPGAMALAPAGVATHFTQDRPAGFLFAAVPHTHVQKIIDDACPGFLDFGCLHSGVFYDATVAMLCARIWEEAVDDAPHGQLFADGVLLALIAKLVRLSGQNVVCREPHSGGAVAPRLARALDLIEDRLADDLTLTDLADAAALSPAHFCRSFRAVTGTSPHVYLQMRRIERAKRLLEKSDKTLVEIAFACGFKSQSHFGQAFRRSVATTPKLYRKTYRL